jgi:uncharacterized membrane protein YraQ (UPF0718 family)
MSIFTIPTSEVSDAYFESKRLGVQDYSTQELEKQKALIEERKVAGAMEEKKIWPYVVFGLLAAGAITFAVLKKKGIIKF